MEDQAFRILNEQRDLDSHQLEQGPGVSIDEDEFDELGYVRLNPDVAEAIRKGTILSGYRHYIEYGYSEGRLLSGEPRNRLIDTASASASTHSESVVRHACDCVLISQGGGLMIVGWIDDANDPVDTVRVVFAEWRVLIDGAQLVRMRRPDVADALGDGASTSYGYFGFLFFDKPLKVAGPCTVEVRLHGGATAQLRASSRYLDDFEMRNTVLTYLTSASFFGNAQVEGIAGLDRGLGAELVRFNRAIATRILSAPYVERFGRQTRKPSASLVVCIYGKAEFQFLQNCLYAGLPGIEDYEFIFVCNSPELAEGLLLEARSTTLVYGLDQTIVALSGNAGFGAANNAAAGASHSNRVVVLNPDVVPRDQDWARKHTDLISSQPTALTRLFGTSLYYDDGSLMHGGMYFDVDTSLSMASGQPRPCPMVRVEHYGKGTPSWSEQFVRPRPVPAVSGAFISADRAWFEQLGGFTEDYIFGHYEDADLCLKSLEKGTPAWLHDLKMWHLEGKGSTRLPPHEGGSLVNRWLFSKRWLPTIEAGLLGQAPTHPLLVPLMDPAVAPRTLRRNQLAQRSDKLANRAAAAGASNH